MRRNQWAGFSVVGACTLDVGDGMPRGVEHLTPSLDTLADEVAELKADTIAIAGTRMLDHGDLRRIAWRLEGRGVNLVVVPEVIDFAGPRIEIRPVDGLPLLHIDDPEFTGFKRWLKGAFDRVAASFIALVVSPLLLGIAFAILVTEGRPVFYKQARVGKAGASFKMWKFRTMTRHAEQQLEALLDMNEHDGVLFKIRNDPRVTPIGRWLRRHSLDELPQLWNVINGTMSLVGPRPPLAYEVERFGDDMRRRLLVKPGMTGLWQVNGRADVAWEETVQLDLHYVENWSVMMDFVVLWKTLRVVVEGRGGY
jgi:exopolysaccharide biosynthesis polyprenyl glycosylphosphotransferase